TTPIDNRSGIQSPLTFAHPLLPLMTSATRTVSPCAPMRLSATRFLTRTVPGHDRENHLHCQARTRLPSRVRVRDRAHARHGPLPHLLARRHRDTHDRTAHLAL